MTARDEDTIGTTVPDDAAEETPDLATFRASDERFAIGDELGRGGMGRVLAAADGALRRSVAIKQALSDDPDDLIRFEREVRITAQLEHPSIVPIYDVGLDRDGKPFYVMRRIDGEPLGARIEDTRDPRARLALLPKVLAAIDAAAFAHARNIIHRDIKPSNILLGAYGETWLIDWGLARRLDEPEPRAEESPAVSLPGEALTIAGHVYGTAAYMAPEQARGEPVDARADVYALGATLFHVLAGSGPFHGVSAAERIARAVTGDDPPHRLPDDIAPELGAIVAKAMANDPANRYRDARELAADLRAFLDGQLVAAHRYTAMQRARRLVRRHRAVFVVAGLATILLVVGGTLAVSNIIAQRDLAQRERDRADDRAMDAQLERASVLANTDPTRAIALLANLPDDPKYLRRMRDIASSAAAHGVIRAGNRQHGSITGLSLSPDGRSIASGADDRTVAVYDVQSKVPPQLFDGFGKQPQPVFVADRVIVVGGGTGLVMIDLATTTRRVLDPASRPYEPWLVRDGVVRYTDLAHQTLVELDLASGATRVLAGAVTGAVGDGELAIVAGDAGVIGVIGSTTKVLHPAAPLAVFQLGVDATRKRFAAAIGPQIFEWDADGRELHRWPMQAFWIKYGAGRLIANVSGSLIELDVTTQELFRAPMTVWTTTTKAGLVVLFDDGRMRLIDGGEPRALDVSYGQSRMVASRPDRSIIAVGSQDGTVRWWNADHVWPRLIDARMLQICGWTDRSVYGVRNMSTLEIIDRQTGTSASTTGEPLLITGTCGMLPDGRISFPRYNSIWLVEPKKLSVLELSRESLLYWSADNHVYFARDTKLYELNGNDAKLVWTAPKEITYLSVADGGAFLILRGMPLVHVDLGTGVLTVVDIPPRQQWLHQTGKDTMLYAKGKALVRWTPAGTRFVWEAPAPIIEIYGTPDDATLVRLDNGELWVLDGMRISNRGTRSEKAYAFGDGIGLTMEGGKLLTHWFVSGEVTSRSLPGPWVPIVSDPSSIGVKSGMGLLIFDDPVPTDPSQLRAWIANATNARIDPKTDALAWD